VLYNRYSGGVKKCMYPALNGFAISGHSVKVVSAVLGDGDTFVGRSLEDLRGATWGSFPNLKKRTFAFLLGHLSQKLRIICEEFLRIFALVPDLGLLSDTPLYFDSFRKLNREQNISESPFEEVNSYVRRNMLDWLIQQDKAVVVFVVFSY